MQGGVPKPHIHILAYRKVTGVLVHAGRGLVDTGVFDELHFCACGGVFEDCVGGSISVGGGEAVCSDTCCRG